MKLATAQFEGQANSVEALTRRGDILDRQMLSQTDKVQKLKEALQNAAGKYGESDRRTQEWQISLNKAEAELVKTKGSIEKNNEALEDATQKTKNLGQAQDETGGQSKGLGSIIDGLAGKIGISLPSNITKSLDGMVNLDSKMAGTIAIGAAFAATIFEIEKALAKMTFEAAANMDEIAALSLVTGISTQALQEYTYASEFLEVSVDTITGSQTKMINQMDAARSGTKEAADAFHQLHVRITNGNGTLRDSGTVFWEVIDALGKMKNETERDAAALDIFGRSARELNPLIRAGSDTMAKFRQEAHDVGYVLDEEAQEALLSLDDTFQRFDKSVDGAKNRIAVEFAPALERLTGVGSDLFQKMSEAAEDSGLIAVFSSLLDIVSSLGPLFEVLFGTLGDGTSSILMPLAITLGVVADALSLIVNLVAIVIEAFRQLFKLLDGTATSENLDRYAANLNRIFSDQGASARAWNATIGKNADGTDYWRGGLTWVGERGPEVIDVPEGARIYSNEESQQLGGDIFYVTIDAKSVQEFNDVVRIAKEARITKRAGYNKRRR
jgi:chaperonin cofactor prefoldin